MKSLPPPARSLLPAIPQRLRLWRKQGAVAKAWPQQDFLPPEPDLEDTLAETPPRLLRNTHYVAVVLFLALVLIASLVKVDMIVAAPGRLAADSPTIVVQPLQISIVREVRVKAGDIVHKGDVLAELDPTFTQADKAVLTAQQDALQARIARLEAESNDSPLQLEGDSADRQLELTLYQQRQSEYASRLHAFDEDSLRFKAAMAAAQESRDSLVAQLEIARKIEAMRAKLYKQQYGSELNYMDAQVTRMRTERDYQDASNRFNEAQHFLNSTQADRQAYIDGWRRQALEELARARTDSTAVTEGLAKAVRMNDLVVLTAPEDGIVLEVAKRSVGSVLQEAEPLVTMVPTGTALIAEVMINSADVGYTKLGDEVAIKVDAFPYQRHGLLQGRLRAVGEDSISTNAPAAMAATSALPIPGVVHRSQVALSGTELHDLPAGTRLIPGMTLTAEIKVGSRSVISYFLYPLMRGFDESIREP
jgi:HlyD family secretion protein